jgi:peptidoglycan hydrolase CwlO-like protein
VSDFTTALREVLPPAAVLICTAVLFALRWRDKQCTDESTKYEARIKALCEEHAKEVQELDDKLAAAQLDARNQRDARISEAQAIVGEYRMHVEASTNAIERLEETLDTHLRRLQ